MTPAAAEAWCAAHGAAVQLPGRRPYFLVWLPAPDDPAGADVAVGEYLAEAVLAMQAGRTRRFLVRDFAPEACHCSGGEPCP